MARSLARIGIIYSAFLLAIVVWPVSTFALTLPTLGVAESREDAGKVVAYVEWTQPDGAQDYGYVVTKDVNGQEQVLVELKPAPLGNTQLSNGGVFVDSSVMVGQTYTYHVYPFQRNEFQLGDVSDQSQRGNRPSLEIVIAVTDPASTTRQTTPPPQPPAGGAGQCSPNQLIDPQKSIGQNLACIYNQSLEIILWIIILTLIVAGYIYITSGGNADRVKLAKELLSAALIGGILYFAIPLMMEALGLQ